MLDIVLICNDTEAVKRGLVSTGADPAMIDRVLELDALRRELQRQGDTLRAELNAISKEIGKEQNEQRRQELIANVSGVKARLKENAARVPEAERDFRELMLSIPNLPLEEVPVGPNESANEIIDVFGQDIDFGFTPKPHWELMTDLGIIDFERGQKISGSRFYVLKGAGARLQRALISWMLDVHVRENGYEEIYPPCMVRADCLVGTGNLPKFGENLYRDAEEDYWWIPTAEVPVTNLYRDEILDGSRLPIRYVAYTPCFRREKMSHGKDTRGIKRGHQFDKVELVQFVRPEKGRDALDELVSHAETILKGLELKYRLVKMCTADLSFVSCLKFDLEAWAPGVGEWLEVSSLSYFGEFQARRARIRFKDESGKNRFVATLNGSGLALPRVVIALIESYQQEDGTVRIPEVLQPYMGGRKSIDKV